MVFVKNLQNFKLDVVIKDSTVVLWIALSNQPESYVQKLAGKITYAIRGLQFNIIPEYVMPGEPRPRVV